MCNQLSVLAQITDEVISAIKSVGLSKQIDVNRQSYAA